METLRLCLCLVLVVFGVGASGEDDTPRQGKILFENDAGAFRSGSAAFEEDRLREKAPGRGEKKSAPPPPVVPPTTSKVGLKVVGPPAKKKQKSGISKESIDNKPATTVHKMNIGGLKDARQGTDYKSLVLAGVFGLVVIVMAKF